MPTSREIQSLLRPLLSRRPDLALRHRVVFFTPVTHYLRGVLFTLSRWRSEPRLVCAVDQLCFGHTTATAADYGPGAYEFELGEDWKQDLEATSRILCEELEQRALPIVEPISDFAEHIKRVPTSWPRDESPVGFFNEALALCTHANFDAAEELMFRKLNGPLQVPERPGPKDSRYEENMYWRTRYLMDALRNDRPKILPLLHEWEEISVGNLGLRKYWDPTPFPCEL